MKRWLTTVAVLFSMFAVCYAQLASPDRIEEVRKKMDALCSSCPKYAESVDISVGGMQLSEMMRTVAELKGVNLSVRDDFDCAVSCSFTRSRIDDLIVFLCKEYDLDIEVYGNIVSVFRYSPPEEPYSLPEIYFGQDTLLTFSFENKKLGDVTDLITAHTQENVIVPTPMRDMSVSASASAVTPGDALEIVAQSNGLDLYVVKGDRSMWCLAAKDPDRGGDSHRGMSARYDYASGDTTAVLPLRHRAVDKVRDIIPNELLEEVNLLESSEMNAFVIHGSAQSVGRVVDFVNRIDVSLPLVEMDVMIVESDRSTSREMGLEVGIDSGATSSLGEIGSGVDLSLGSATTSQLLNKINGFSTINLGNASDRLYVDLKLLEEAGMLTVESTPKLAALNGQTAVLSRGETTYYKEVSSSFYSSQTPVQNQSYVWKEVKADLVITITPHVSLDSLVTMDIDIQQDEFGSKTADDAPPDINRRGFKSTVRVADGDVVLLGGIDTSSDRTTAKGLPWIARVPVLRWLGGRDKRSKSEVKMNVFIRAKIIG